MGKRVLVKRYQEPPKKGIILPDSAKEKFHCGHVVGVGDVPLDLGTLVFFGKYAGIEIELNGEEYLILNEEELLGKIW